MRRICIKSGQATVMRDGLRCAGPHVKRDEKNPSRKCNQLIAKKSSSGQIAGTFKCPRCRQEIEVELS